MKKSPELIDHLLNLIKVQLAMYDLLSKVSIASEKTPNEYEKERSLITDRLGNALDTIGREFK